MNSLIQNYKIILKELTNTCKHITTNKQIRLPKMSDLEFVALNITAEYMSINSELQLFRCISETVWTEKLKETSIIKEKENFYPTLKKSERL